MKGTITEPERGNLVPPGPKGLPILGIAAEARKNTLGAQNAVAVMLLFYEVVTVIDEHLIGSIYRVVIDVERFATVLTSDLLKVNWFNILKVRYSIENVSEVANWAYGHKVFIARFHFGGIWNIRHT